MTPSATPGDTERYDAATAHLEPPFAVVDLDARRVNAAAMTRRAAGCPERLDMIGKAAASTTATSAGGPLRRAKAGELCERFNELHLIEGTAVVATVPTYRGEGKAFL